MFVFFTIVSFLFANKFKYKLTFLFIYILFYKKNILKNGRTQIFISAILFHIKILKTYYNFSIKHEQKCLPNLIFSSLVWSIIANNNKLFYQLK